MSNYFNAPKASRNEAFHFLNTGVDQVVDGDQSAQVHPFPASLPPGQKLGNPLEEQAPSATFPERDFSPMYPAGRGRYPV